MLVRTIISAVILLWMPLQATTLQQLSTDEMIQQATSVVRAKITGSYGVAVGQDIYTRYTLTVLETLKEEPSGKAATEITVPGGSARGVRQVVAGAPTFEVGEEYVVFLWTSRSGMTQVMGLTQGQFSVRQDTQGNQVLLRSASTETMLDKSGRVIADQPLSLRISDLRMRVRQLVIAR